MTIELKQGDDRAELSRRAGQVVARQADHRHARSEGEPDYNEQSRYAKTIRRDNQTWGDVPAKDDELAHADSTMTCFACHTSWMTSCFGCHLSMKANRKMPNRHNEGERLAQLHDLQLPGPARRRVHARPRRHGDGPPRRARRARRSRRARQLAEPEPRVDLSAAADRLGRRLFGAGVHHARPAHRPHQGDEGLHRLPRLEGRTTTTRGWRS